MFDIVTHNVSNQTIICHCEELTVNDLQEVFAFGARSFDDLKRMSRCGMGHCQAKYCYHHANELLATWMGVAESELSGTNHRIPIRPLPLKMLIGSDL
ncbi:(2Fe-2S)-binding protein [Allobacillus halotolerans]|uniref:(2Fe-2S)-binding protein n=1 Tax=Allobacillus halotolerans TaxID=570278 RepID=UPI00236515C9|nr:(2Fe-2S)-binding protein [Allobacillus halotolerans]